MCIWFRSQVSTPSFRDSPIAASSSLEASFHPVHLVFAPSAVHESNVRQQYESNTWSKPLEDEYSRGTILLRSPRAQNLAGVTTLFKRYADVDYEIKCKGGSFSARVVFCTRATCQHFVVLHKDIGFQYAVDSIFCRTTATIAINPFKKLTMPPEWAASSLRCGELLTVACWKIFPDNADKVPTADARTLLLLVVNTSSPSPHPLLSTKSHWTCWKDLLVRLQIMVKTSGRGSLRLVLPASRTRAASRERLPFFF